MLDRCRHLSINMNLHYVHRNWKDDAAMQRALVGPFVPSPEVVQDKRDRPVFRSVDDLLEINEGLEKRIEILESEKRNLEGSIEVLTKKGVIGAVDEFTDKMDGDFDDDDVADDTDEPIKKKESRLFDDCDDNVPIAKLSSKAAKKGMYLYLIFIVLICYSNFILFNFVLYRWRD